MAEKDYTEHYEALGESAAPETVPNTVSRNAHVPDRSFQRVIWESGKPVLDTDLNLSQDTRDFAERLLRRWEMPSGWLRGQTHKDWASEVITGVAPDNVSDDSPGGNLIDEGSIGEPHTLVNSFLLPRREAVVAGWPVVVEFVNTSTTGLNLIGLEPPTIYDGTEATVKRTDFLFLEVWLALVAPSVKAEGAVQVAAIADLADGDVITIGGLPLTARTVAPAGVDEFIIVTGGSAGGHLTALTALTQNDPVYQPGFETADTSVQGAVPFYGVYCFRDRLNLCVPGFVGFIQRNVMKARVSQNPEAFRAASPLDLVGDHAPPFFVIHGDRDTLAPVGYAREFVARLREVSPEPVAYAELRGAQHAFDIFYSPRASRTVEGVERFVTALHERYLDRKSARTSADSAA